MYRSSNLVGTLRHIDSIGLRVERPYSPSRRRIPWYVSRSLAHTHADFDPTMPNMCTGSFYVLQRLNNSCAIYEALQDTVYILVPPRCKKYCTTFCICWTPTLRLKMTATDPAFCWCRLLVLVLSFSQRKCGVCPKKVGKMAFIGCSEFQWTKFAWKLLIELKRYRSKVKVFWNAWAVGFKMVKLQNLSCTKLIVHGQTLLKSVSAVGFTESQVFWKVSLFTVKCFVWLIFD